LKVHWENPHIKLERIVFPNLTFARLFLMNLPFSSWEKLNRKVVSAECSKECQKNTQELANPTLSTTDLNFSVPHIYCSPDTAYELTGLLNTLGPEKKKIKMEILTEDTSESRSSLTYFLQDKVHEYELESIPLCSIVHESYEIALDKQETKSKKRNAKPPASFQRILKKSKPDWFPAIMGTEYYGKKVLESFIKLHLTQPYNIIQQLYPECPLKYYDLTTEGTVELRFKETIPLSNFMVWLDYLQRLSKELKCNPLMIRIAIRFDNWISDGNSKSASSDKFVFSWNDVDMAFQQQDFPQLGKFIQDSNPSSLSTIYFYLTSLIENDDFRIRLLQEIFDQVPIMF
jgi:hypothetical protein